MTATEAANLATARRYIAAIEAGTADDELFSFFTPDVVQETLPNRFLPHGSAADLAGMKEAAARGRQAMASQRYEILQAMASGDVVAMEIRWTGTLAVPFETIPAGGAMRARFAVFLEFRDGKIAAQRNYDCYEPW